MYWALFILSMLVSFFVFFGIAERWVALASVKTSKIAASVFLAATFAMGLWWYATRQLEIVFLIFIFLIGFILFFNRLYWKKEG
jgi:hypothetical protein